MVKTFVRHYYSKPKILTTTDKTPHITVPTLLFMALQIRNNYGKNSQYHFHEVNKIAPGISYKTLIFIVYMNKRVVQYDYN